MRNTNYLKLLLVLQILYSLSIRTSQQPSTPPITTTPVLDIDGHELQVDLRYTILPTQNESSGLGLGAGSKPCPFYVQQKDVESFKGIPTRFMPVDNKQQVINLSTDLNIVFSIYTTCCQSTVWKLGDAEILGRRYVVLRDGTTGEPGAETINNWFRIERYYGGVINSNNVYYKIVFCPAVCSNCTVVCGNVGVFIDYYYGKRWLGLNDEPLVVRFKKALNY